tara:strand:+ start:122 stop:598 length:477 start_codon:yes stop_codon:yes gene_type:complete
MGIIKRVKQIFKKQTDLIMKKSGTFKEENIECSIDKQKIECSKLEAPIFECGPGHFSHGYSPYVGVPAPVYLNDDPWFGPAPVRSQNQIDYMQQEIEIKRREFEKNFSVEPEDIHQRMYEIANQNHNVILDYDYSGGSENFLDGGPNGYGWMSGTGRE